MRFTVYPYLNQFTFVDFIAHFRPIQLLFLLVQMKAPRVRLHPDTGSGDDGRIAILHFGEYLKDETYEVPLLRQCH